MFLNIPEHTPNGTGFHFFPQFAFVIKIIVETRKLQWMMVTIAIQGLIKYIIIIGDPIERQYLGIDIFVLVDELFDGLQ